jgi:hypothetical protein
MLNNVPIQINKAQRQVVLKHPNSMPCTVYRRVLLRPGTQPHIAMGGVPTMGGVGILSSEDEQDIEYQLLGDGMWLYADPVQPGSLTEVGDSEEATAQQRGLVESLVPPGDAGHFVPKRRDLIYLEPGVPGVAIAVEVVEIESRVNIFPHTKVFVCNVRDDAHVFPDNVNP